MDEGDGVGGGDLLGKVGSNSLYSEYLFAFDAGSIFISILFRYRVECQKYSSIKLGCSGYEGSREHYK